MKEIYQIAKKPCKFCGGLITWDKKINGKFPAHVETNGYIINDGGCPKYNIPSKSESSHTEKETTLFETRKFNRFKIAENNIDFTLPIFQGKDPLIPRFYIGKISSELKVLKKILRIPPQFLIFNIWGLAHKLIRRFLEDRKIIAFFKIIKPTEELNDHFIHLYIIPNQKVEILGIDNFIITVINSIIKDIRFTEDLIVNKEVYEELITNENVTNYIRAIKTFFDALVYRIRFQWDKGEFSTTTYFDLIENDLYFYVDLDAMFYGIGAPTKVTFDYKKIRT